MLDTTKISVELCKFFEQYKEMFLFKEKYKEILMSSYKNLSNSSHDFFDKVNLLNIPFLFAYPYKGFEDFQIIDDSSNMYRAGSVDGSQIENFDYVMSGVYDFLINIGSIILDYENCDVPYRFSYPKIFNINEIREFTGLDTFDIRSFSRTELISSIRTYYEYDEALNLIDRLKEGDLLFMDGGLVQWHLQDKPINLKKIIVDKISEVLNKGELRNIYIVGYISGSKAKDVVNCLKIYNCKNNTFDCNRCNDEFCYYLDNIDDSFLFQSYFKVDSNEFVATPIFQSRAKITNIYKLPIYFFYIYNSDEFARIEITQNNIKNVSIITKKIKDQLDKGFGYPIVLSEAHEMAVVGDNDKTNFERIMKTINPEFDLNFTSRSKVLSKKFKFV
ncbi:MAG: DNA double-strand break repair nuclease NurA [Caldisericia bacterium]|nr:DNA double-strand break repair nuclease NurA [Caldisericia bacterium]